MTDDLEVTTNVTEPWQLDADDMPEEEFADGLRISTDCVARRLIEPLDSARYFDFPEHLSKRGHGFEWILQRWLRRNHKVDSIREVVVPWEYGETHLDLLMAEPRPAFDVDGALQVEVKANKEARVKSENVRQVQRQMFVVERAIAAGRPFRARIKVDGKWEWVDIDPQLYAEIDWRIVVIDPATWRIPDPRGVRVPALTDDRRRELEVEWEQMAAFMALGPNTMRWNIEWPSKMPPCSCGKCFTPELRELDEKLIENAALYANAREEEAYAAAEKKLHGDYMKSVLLGDGAELRDAKGSYVGGGWKVTLTKAGAINVTKSEAKPTPQL